MGIQALDYKRSAERWQRYGEKYHDQAATHFVEVNKTALTIATILFGFFGVFLQTGDPKEFSLCVKLLLASGFISLTISVIIGIALFIKANEFLNKAGDYYEKLSEKLFLWMVKHNKKAGFEYPNEIYKGLNPNYFMSSKLSMFQLIFLGGGFVCIAFSFFFLLF